MGTAYNWVCDRGSVKSGYPVVAMMSDGELLFIGLGLSGAEGMTVKALRELRACDIIYAEFYTSDLLDGGKEDLQEMAGKDIVTLDRAGVEESDACWRLSQGFSMSGPGV